MAMLGQRKPSRNCRVGFDWAAYPADSARVSAGIKAETPVPMRTGASIKSITYRIVGGVIKPHVRVSVKSFLPSAIHAAANSLVPSQLGRPNPANNRLPSSQCPKRLAALMCPALPTSTNRLPHTRAHR